MYIYRYIYAYDGLRNVGCEAEPPVLAPGGHAPSSTVRGVNFRVHARAHIGILELFVLLSPVQRTPEITRMVW